MTTKAIPLASIVFDAGTQIRAAIDQGLVAEYADAMTEGAHFPAIVVFHDGNQHYLADGFHRFMAAQRNQFRDIEAVIRPGTKEDALWFALGANKANGKRLTEADKKHAIVLAISAWPDKSAGVIAEQLGVNHVYVTRIRQQEFTTQDLPDRVVGRDGKTYPAKRDTPAVIEERRDEQREAVAALVRQGRQSKDIIAELGVRPETVARVRRELGVGIDNAKESVAQRRQDIRDMAERGYTSRQIASSLNISSETVTDIAKKQGIVIHADRVVGRTRRHDSNRIVEQMVLDAESLCADINLIDFDALDGARLSAWIESLGLARQQLGTFIRRLREQQKHGEAA